MESASGTKTMRKALRRSFPAMALACLALAAGTAFAQTQWVATWATSPEPLVSAQSAYNPPSPGLANNSVRQMLRVSIGGDTLRMRFTNEYTPTAGKIDAVTIAKSAGEGVIDTTTLKHFKFNGNDSITMPESSYVWSDPLAFHLTQLETLQVTIYFGTVPASGTYPGTTVHRGSRTVPRVLAGNQITARTFAGADTIAMGSWVISSMEVRAPATAGAVAILGNSITDGLGSTTDAFNRWTDIMEQNFLAHAGTSQVGMLNGGIGAGCMEPNCGTSTAGILRYKRDLFGHSGVKWILILLGVNDIGTVTTSSAATTLSNNLFSSYGTIIDSAHARGIKAYGVTITPFGGYSAYYNTNSEACRSKVNAWIRTSGKYDAVIDFDKVIRSTTDTTKIPTNLTVDGLHPTVAGHALLGNSVDTNLFIQGATSIGTVMPSSPAGYSVGEASASGRNSGLAFQFQIPRETFVSLKVYSATGMEIVELAGKVYSPGEHTVEFKGGNLAKGVYLYSFKADSFSATRKMILPAP